MTEKKMTFAESLESLQAQRNNSDLSNLATAYERLTATLMEINKLRNEITTLAGIIERGESYQLEDVKSLYDAARKLGVSI